MLRHAVIGCGKVAGYGHLPAVRQTAALQLAAVCDRDTSRCQQASQTYGVPGFASVEEMFRSVELDSVTLCTTLPTHCELALAVAEAGKHCFLEKPMALTAGQCDQMVAAFDKAAKVLAVNFEYRLTALFGSIRADIGAGRIGRLLSMRFVYNWDNHWHRPEFRPRRAAFLNEGFGCMDCGVHYLDMARFVSGSDFVRLAAEGTWAEPQFAYPSHIHAVGRLANGAMCSLEESFAYTVNAKDSLVVQSFDFVGDRGVIRVDRPPGETHMVVRRHFPDATSVQVDDGGKPWPIAYAEFARVAGAGRLDGSALASGGDGAEAIRLTEQIIEQCRQGRVENVE